MKQAVISPSFDGKLHIKENVGKPNKIKENQVLIHVAAAGINRADLLQAEGKYPAPIGVPQDVPGLEISGHIIKAGDAVAGFAEGDRVCALVPGGGYSEYIVVDSRVVLPVPRGLDLVQAAALPEALFTVWFALKVKAQVQKGEKVLVHCASSGIGSFAVQIAGALGCEVVATASSIEKQDFVRSLGALYVADYRSEGWSNEIKEAIGGVDVVLDPLTGKYMQQNLSLLDSEGRYVIIALMDNKASQINVASLLMKNLSVYGITLRSQPIEVKERMRDAIKELLWPLIEEEKKVVPCIYAELSLSEVQKAHEIMRARDHKGKLVLTFD